MKSGVSFLLQGIHTTLVHHYNDTLNFLILSTPTNTTTVQVSKQRMEQNNNLVPITCPIINILQGFSISRIAGALCDEGQNYKNVVGFFKGLRKSLNILV